MSRQFSPRNLYYLIKLNAILPIINFAYLAIIRITIRKNAQTYVAGIKR